jgi:hypothetical protein
VGGEAELSAASDFADAIMKYYESPELMKSHGKAARSKILKEFRWKDIASSMMDAVHKTVGASGQQRAPIPSITRCVVEEVTDKVTDKDDSQLCKLESMISELPQAATKDEDDTITDIGKRINMLILKNRK